MSTLPTQQSHSILYTTSPFFKGFGVGESDLGVLGDDILLVTRNLSYTYGLANCSFLLKMTRFHA